MSIKKYYEISPYDFVGVKANFHTHTKRCMHAAGEDREYVEAAIEGGFKVLGFSDHTPYDIPGLYEPKNRMTMGELEEYVNSIQALKKKYEKDITIFMSLEVEYFSRKFDGLMKEVSQYPFDYLILAQHYIDDENKIHANSEPGSDESYVKTYVDQLIRGIQTGYFNYVAHPDLIGFTGPAAIYKKHMIRLAQELKKQGIPQEFNALGYRHYRHYPNIQFVEMGIEAGNDFVIGVDAHEPGNMVQHSIWNECKEIVINRGGKILNI